MSTQQFTPVVESPRLLRPVGAPLALYLRPGRNDHGVLLGLLAEGREDLSGIVFDPCLEGRQAELLTEVRRHHIEAVLDPRTIELATPGGVAQGRVTELPWAGQQQPHTTELLSGAAGEQLVEVLADYVVKHKFSAVLAPTHYLRSATDPWLEVDTRLVRRLRRVLDAAGLGEVPIYYPLALPTTVLHDTRQRTALAAALGGLPIDALWLRVHPFGSASGPLALRRYIEGCRALHALGLPLVAERTGTVGLALLAFGAVGGIEGGITFGERYDVGGLLRPPANGTPFSPPPRVYLPQLGAFVTRGQAGELFEHRQMKTTFGCRDAGCCRRGVLDMTADPRRHFIIRRTSEVNFYSRPPEPVRAGLYLEEFLRPATDLALRAARVQPALEATRRRLEAWRHTLGAMHQAGPPQTFAVVPEGRCLDAAGRRAGA